MSCPRKLFRVLSHGLHSDSQIPSIIKPASNRKFEFRRLGVKHRAGGVYSWRSKAGIKIPGGSVKAMTPFDSRIAGAYDYPVAIVAVCISVLASYTALDLAERITSASGFAKRLWLASGAVVLGIGIWSMHYTAMWAFRLPVPVLYHWPTVLLSLLAGVASSIIALFAATRTRIGKLGLLVAAVFQGAGIATMHYTAMASMRLPAMCHYSPFFVALSILIAIAGSLMSLWLIFLFRNDPRQWRLRRAASAVLMGAAISSMHFTGMAAASFTADNQAPDFSHSVRVTLLGTAGLLAIAVIVLFGAVITALVDRLQEKSAQLDRLFQRSPLPIVVIDENGRVYRLNPEFTRFFGYSGDESVGRELAELIAPGELGQDFKSSAELVGVDERADGQTVRQCKDDRRVHVLVVSVPVSLPGKKSEVWVIYRDISARMKAEEALQAVSSRLLEVQEAERRLLASELHDEIGQLLTGLRLLLKLNREASTETINSRFDQARNIVDELLRTVRTMSFDLRPSDLDQFGLLPALLGLFERFTGQTGILVEFKHRNVDRRFASKVETGAYRVVQEALTNVARHASVGGVRVRLWTEGNTLNLQIDDRGLGFDPDVVMKMARSSGLFGMAERVRLIGGRLTIDSSPGSGTTITAEVPVDDQSAQNLTD